MINVFFFLYIFTLRVFLDRSGEYSGFIIYNLRKENRIWREVILFSERK